MDELAERRLRNWRKKAATTGFDDIAEFVTFLRALGTSTADAMTYLHELWMLGKIDARQLAKGMDACAR